MIDLVSDTVTQPSPEMRKAMANAEVGDSQRGEDPTANRLQDTISELLNKDASLFLPSSTMANEIAYKVFTRPGDELILDRQSHTIDYEGGAPAMLSGVMLRTVNGNRGVFSEDELKAAIRPDEPYAPRTRLVSIENTHNLGGGKGWPIGRLTELCEAADENGIPVHMDGSRLMNAVVASGVKAREYASPANSVTLCFSKGLGAPVGAALAGKKDFIKEARRYQQAFGGGMRQAGIIAAGALYAIEHNIDRLADDHANARLLAERLADEDSIDINPSEVETNIVFFRVDKTGMTAREFTDRMMKHGVRMGYACDGRIRAVTHMGINHKDVMQAATLVHELLVDVLIGAER